MMTECECAICMSNSCEEDDRLACDHSISFCKECITICIKNKIYDCPLCRKEFNITIPNEDDCCVLCLWDYYRHLLYTTIVYLWFFAVFHTIYELVWACVHWDFSAYNIYD